MTLPASLGTKAPLEHWATRPVLARERYHVVSILSEGLCGTVLLACSMEPARAELNRTHEVALKSSTETPLVTNAGQEVEGVLDHPPDVMDEKREEDCVVIKAIPKMDLDLAALKVLRDLTATLYLFKHRYINRLIRHFEDADCFYHVFEFLPGGDLYSRLEQRGRPFTEHQALFIVRQVLDAVAYIHEKGFTHRDIKLENLVFKTKSDSQIQVLQLIDFDLLIRTPASGCSQTIPSSENYAELLQHTTSPTLAARQSGFSRCTSGSPYDLLQSSRGRDPAESPMFSRMDTKDEYGSAVDETDDPVCTSTVWGSNATVRIEPYESSASSASHDSSQHKVGTALRTQDDGVLLPSPLHMMPELVGTILYVSPEIAANIPHIPEQSDMWAVGILFYSLIAFCMPFQASSTDEVLNQIRTSDPDFSGPSWHNISSETLHLISSLLSKDGTSRPTAAAALSIVKDIQAKLRNSPKSHNKNNLRAITPSLSMTRLGRRISFTRSRARLEAFAEDSSLRETKAHSLQSSVSQGHLIDHEGDGIYENRQDEYADATAVSALPENTIAYEQEPRRAHSMLATVRAVSLGFRRRHGDSLSIPRDHEACNLVAPDDTDEESNPVDKATKGCGGNAFADSISNSFFRPKVPSSALAKIAHDYRDVETDPDSSSRGGSQLCGGVSAKFGSSPGTIEAGDISFRGRSSVRALLRAVAGNTRKAWRSPGAGYDNDLWESGEASKDAKPRNSLSARRLKRVARQPRRFGNNHFPRLPRDKQNLVSHEQPSPCSNCTICKAEGSSPASQSSFHSHFKLQPSQQQAVKEAYDAVTTPSSSAARLGVSAPVSCEYSRSWNRQTSFGRTPPPRPATDKRQLFRISRDWNRQISRGREDRHGRDATHHDVSKCRHSLETTAFITKDFVPVPDDMGSSQEVPAYRTSRIRVKILARTKGPRHTTVAKRWRMGGSGSLNLGSLTTPDQRQSSH